MNAYVVIVFSVLLVALAMASPAQERVERAADPQRGYGGGYGGGYGAGYGGGYGGYGGGHRGHHGHHGGGGHHSHGGGGHRGGGGYGGGNQVSSASASSFSNNKNVNFQTPFGPVGISESNSGSQAQASSGNSGYRGR